MRRRNGIGLTIFAAIALALAAMLAACHRPQVSERSKYFTISPEGWAYGDTLAWTPVDTAKVDTASIIVAMRHANDYPYANIWLEYSYFAPTDSAPRVDTINIWLADEYGRWFGSGIGVGYQLSDTAMRHSPIDLSRPVCVRHIMRTDCLPGIQQVGLIIN